jgi:hypothetical protein
VRGLIGGFLRGRNVDLAKRYSPSVVATSALTNQGVGIRDSTNRLFVSNILVRAQHQRQRRAFEPITESTPPFVQALPHRKLGYLLHHFRTARNGMSPAMQLLRTKEVRVYISETDVSFNVDSNICCLRNGFPGDSAVVSPTQALSRVGRPLAIFS